MDSHLSSSTLYIVGTPIGNLSDISPRAVTTLREADIIAAEDTRHTIRLLEHLSISGKKLISYHDHIEEKRARELISQIGRAHV